MRTPIPSRAGLGGGSSDAAAVLRHFAQGRTDAEIRALAATLGADVPVCYGQRAARMRGIGEILDFIELPGPVWLMIATPSFGCSTPEVYRAYDELAPPARVGREIEAPPHWDGIVTSLRNDLELAAWAVEPRLAEFREKVECAIVRDAFLCGSGSSYAAWFNNQAEAEACAAAVGAAIPDLRLLVSTRCQ